MTAAPRRAARSALALVGALVALVALAAGCSSPARTGADVGQNRYVQGDGKTIVYPVAKRAAAPAVTGTTLDGTNFSLASAHGQVVVVNFWAEWCAPCVLESSALVGTYKSTKDSGVVFLGVNSRDEKDKAKAFQADHLSYPSLFDPTGRVALKFADVASTLPTTVVIDRDGRVAAAVHDAVTEDGLTALVRQIAGGH